MYCIRHSFFCGALVFFLGLPGSAFSQIADNFSDGDFSQNPTWQGDAASFLINPAGELQLNAAAAGTSLLTVQGNIPDSAVWSLHFRLGFAPSTNNLLRIYLLADLADLAVANGYFLEIGETGSLDALRLFRQDAGAKTLLATGQGGLVATNPDIRLRARRTVAGTWTLEAAAGNGALQPQFEVTDAAWGGGNNRFFGFQCIYTASNTGKFYFDDLNIQPDVPDTKAPVLVSALAQDASLVATVFDEDLDSLSAVQPGNYQISGGVGQPQSAALLADKRTVHLLLASPLATGSYTLQTSGIKDVKGNTATTQTANFQYVKIDAAAEFDILINEIMADPTPSAGLPEVEWLELFNRSDKTIELSTLRIQDATGSPVTLPAFAMPPGTYVVLTALLNAAVLQAATGGTVLGSAIGTTTLNNDGDALTLSDQSGLIVDRVEYGPDWHTDADKSEGGWSLERINPGLPCLGRKNWQSCPTLPGGTPGLPNAAYQNTPDNEAPHLLAAFPESATTLLLTFSEGLDKNVAEISTEYHLSPARIVASAVQLPDVRAQVRLTLADPLQPSVLYALTVGAAVADCSGNGVPATDTVFLGLTEKPAPRDIVVNEILFNPATGGSRYVEFYNRSNKIFDWSEFFLANFSGGSDVEQITQDRLFLPGQIHVFSNDPTDIRTRFANIHALDVIGNLLPSLDDNEGNITLYWSKNGETVVLDSFDYVDDYHNAFLSGSEREGVALERIDPEGPTNAAANWTSASAAITGAPGTPTLPNSQHLNPVPTGDGPVTLSAGRLSPDGDGFEDFLDIGYTLPLSGYFAAVTVFDAEGIPVKRLSRQELLGTEGSLRWDGDLDDGTPARPGIYVLLVELYAPSGAAEQVKKAVAVVGRF